jgi:NADH-quinone oxidoreductase subunit F
MPDQPNQSPSAAAPGLLPKSGQSLASVQAYQASGGHVGLRRALTMPPEQVIDEIRNAGLRGRGGAGVLAGEKLLLVGQAEAETKYVVCNAYDADPRSLVAAALLEQNPHVVLEGMAIAAYACGASEGFLFVRSTRADAVASAQRALAEAQERGWLGRNIGGAAFDFAITFVAAERGYMGGEESTMLQILKGKPMKAVQRPPYPTTIGLFDQPTAILNVETLANLPRILVRGGQAFREVGTADSPGTKLITVIPASGEPRLVEMPFGAPLRQVLRAAGAEANESLARAIAVGGMEGGVLPLALLNTPYDYEPLEDAGAIVGSSVVEVLPVSTCMVHFAMERSAYLAEETCGKCIPCRVGVKRVAGTLEGIASGLGAEGDLALLDEFSHYIPDGSLCGFGVNAVHTLVTAMKYFADDFKAHLTGNCPTGTCVPVRAHRYATKHVL